MIENQEQFRTALYQLANFKGMLEAVQRHLEETEPKLVPLVSESYRHRIQELQAEICDYLLSEMLALDANHAQNALMDILAQKSLMDILAEKEDIRLIPFALTLFLTPTNSREIVTTTEKLLIRLLPRLRADHKEILTEETRNNLRSILALPWSHVDLTVAALKALEQVGDKRDLAAVRPLVKFEKTDRLVQILYSRYWRESRERVRQAAQDCLPFLEQRIEEGKLAQTLLRPASATDDAADTLLRATTANPDTTPPEQLLRPKM